MGGLGLGRGAVAALGLPGCRTTGCMDVVVFLMRSLHRLRHNGQYGGVRHLQRGRAYIKRQSPLIVHEAAGSRRSRCIRSTHVMLINISRQVASKLTHHKVES